MTHRSADILSDAIDRILGQGNGDHAGHLQKVMHSLAEAFPEVEDQLARERVRRRLHSYSPVPRTPQQLLLERAGDGLERIRLRFTGEEYVPWPAVVGAAAVVVVAAVALAYLRRKGLQEPVVEA
jgi:hypothetical protein